MSKKKILFRIFTAIIAFVFIILIAILSINKYVKFSVSDSIITPAAASELDNTDCILILGAGVWDGNRPSPMLRDRLDEGINLYNLGCASKIIMSGDHGREDYDEVNVMKAYAIEKGVKSEDIFMDHAGFSTYESIYRAKSIFEVKKMIVVTQKYHLYRALYVSEQLGIDAYGVGSDPQKYSKQNYRELREIIARNKDFFAVKFNIKPTFLGETIPVNGDGNITNDG